VVTANQLGVTSAFGGRYLGLVRHPDTIWGWAYYGRRDCKLEVVSVAGHWHTSAGALRRFIEAGTRQHSAESALNVNEQKV
jgi:hypothetical protein